MSNRKCDRWLKLRSTEYDVLLVESLKFEQYQFAQVLVTCESTQLSQFTRMRDSARARTHMLDGARDCSYLRVRTCIKSVPYNRLI